MVISSGEKPLTELIRELIRQELKRGETTSKGGNTLITSEKDLHLVTRGTHKAYYNGVEIVSGGGSDEKVKVSSNDTTPGYLNGKLVAGVNISLTEGSDGGNETLTVALTGGGVGDVYLANDNIFTGDHQYISGAGGSTANYPTLAFKNATYINAFYSVLRVDDSGYLEIGTGDSFFNKLSGKTYCAGSFVPFSSDTYDLGSTTFTQWWRNVYAQKYYVDDATSYISNVTNAIGIYLSSALVANFGAAVVNLHQHLHMNDFTIDVRADNVHTIGYASGTNSLDIQSYDEMRFLLTQNAGVVPMSIMTDGIRVWEALFFRKNQASDTVYIVDDATANMEFHVGAGKVFEFIVG